MIIREKINSSNVFLRSCEKFFFYNVHVLAISSSDRKTFLKLDMLI